MAAESRCPRTEVDPGFPGGSAPLYQSVTRGIKLVKVQESASSQTDCSPKRSYGDVLWCVFVSSLISIKDEKNKLVQLMVFVCVCSFVIEPQNPEVAVQSWVQQANSVTLRDVLP